MSDATHIRRATAHWLKRADQALDSASDELKAGRYEFSVNRAYYAVFYAATAVLLQRGRHFVRHAGVRSAFHEELIKTRLMSVEFGEAYDMLFERRLLADYGALVEVSRDEADRSLADASRLVAALKRLAATGGAAS